MKKDNVVQRKSYDFALSKQLLRSGSSMGVNIEEAIGGQSKKDFLAGMNY